MTDEDIKKALIESDNKAVRYVRMNESKELENIKFSPIEAQLAFIKELMENETEAKAFLKDPVKYSSDHGILLSKDVVKLVTNSVLFDEGIHADVLAKLGPHSLKDLIDMRAGVAKPGVPQTTFAIPALLLAAAAIVSAVATLVTAVRRKKVQESLDLSAIQGLSEKGVTLPSGKRFIARDPER